MDQVMQAQVIETLENGIQILSLNRLDKRNAITLSMYQSMSDALLRAASDDAIVATIITGEGPDFSAGNDIYEFVEIAKVPEKMAPTLAFLQAVSTYPKPLISAVEGWAVGIGATLMLHCDLVFAARNTQFVFPFVPLGLVPEASSSLLLPRLLGHQRAFELLVLGDPLVAERACEWGMVNHLCEPGETRALALTYAERIAQLPVQSIKLSKSLIKGAIKQDVQDVLIEEGNLFKERLSSTEARAQFARFVSKARH